jgi:hypothetical protein
VIEGGTMKRFAFCLGLVSLPVFAFACGGASKEPEEPKAELTSVDSSVVVGKCPDAKGFNANAVNSTIKKLVAPCDKVPGGAAHFSATLLPGGRIKLASPEGDAAQGVVPTCVLENQLMHKIYLKSPCNLDVLLEEHKIAK